MLAIKSLVAILILFILTKILGKKQLGQLNMFDYVIGISIGNIVAEMSVNREVPFFDGVTAMVVYTLISVFISYITTKSIKIRRFVSGVPVVVIENGKIIEKNLMKIKFDINDLLEEARVNGYFDISEIEYSIMEVNGRLSFLPKSKYVPIKLNDMKLKAAYKGLCANLVIDGNIMKESLKFINKDYSWLITRLKNMGYNDISDLLLVVCDSNEVLTIFEKNVIENGTNCLE